MPLPAPAPPPAERRETAAGEGRLDAVFAALADPTRRRILAMLLEDDMAVSDVAQPFAMSLAAISKHLATLAGAGLIRQERRGRITWCQIDPEGMRGASVWMRAFGHLDPIDLDDFERFLATEFGAGRPETGPEEDGP